MGRALVGILISVSPVDSYDLAGITIIRSRRRPGVKPRENRGDGGESRKQRSPHVDDGLSG